MTKLSKEELEKKLATFVGLEIGPPQQPLEPVNESMIFHWCEALGDNNSIYTDPEAAKNSVHGGIVAPPAMLQVWSMRGLEMYRGDGGPTDKQGELHALLSENGYSGVVATNCEQDYTRYLRPGDRISGHTVIESISEEKATALGIGYFINTRTTFADQNGEEVGWMTFRVLKFKAEKKAQPATTDSGGAAEAPKRMRPVLGHDNKWWWDRINEGELPIQRCKECGTLRHPTRPMCWKCQSLEWDYVVASGKGTVYSFVVIHHPPFPGFEYPLTVAVIELEEGTRLVSNIVGIDHEDVKIGMPVKLSIENVDEEMKLPLFRPAN
jgi:uncharacterized OB-fold protein/acyl dehydratase